MLTLDWCDILKCLILKCFLFIMAGGESRVVDEASGTRSLPSEGRHADVTSSTSVMEMGSTDSAGNAHGGGGPSCGLVSSLFPSSCRGRAEAFARRLHRRLTSLGGDETTDPQNSKPNETSWLHAPTGGKNVTLNNTNSNHVLQRQPRHSPDTDLYYDFDMDLEDDGPSSPQEEATAAELADLLVNPRVMKTNHCNTCPTNGTNIVPTNQDLESSCTFASPITGTPPESDASELYFDPVSSDPEKPKNEVYFDPVVTSDSETISNLSNGCAALKKKAPPPRKNLTSNFELLEDTSESSLSSRRNHVDKQRHRNDIVGSPEDSSNGRSSQDTTSPSHESLWSTFDESTVSLQDDNPSRVNCSSNTTDSRLSKSHSDSEIPINGTRETSSRKSDITEESIDEVDFLANPMKNGTFCEPNKCALNAAEEGSPDRLVESVEELPLDDEGSLEDWKGVAQNVVSSKVDGEVVTNTDADQSTYSSTLNIPGTLSVECSLNETLVQTTLKSESEVKNENGPVTNGTDEEKMCLLLQKLATSPTVKVDLPTPLQASQEDATEEDDDEEEEEERPPKVRRCSSLKSGKTPPGTPGRKKIVRFADVLGLDLADVRTFLDEIPKIPNSAYSDLVYDEIFQKDSSPVNSIPNNWGNSLHNRYVDTRRGCSSIGSRKFNRTLVPLFQQPGGLPNFLDLVRERRVCLENAIVEDPLSLSIQGTVRVLNLDFHKSVHIRYTLNSWRNFSDLQATYVPNSCDGFSDKFSFVLYCHTLQVGQRLEFAVRFHCKGAQYWDNNSGANYCFQCLAGSSSVGYIPITVSDSPQHDWTPMFY